MTDKSRLSLMPLWLLGMTALVLPLTPSVAGIESLSRWVGWEQVGMLLVLALIWHGYFLVQRRLRLDTSVVLACLSVALLLFSHSVLVSHYPPTMLLWEWLLFLLMLPPVVAVIKVGPMPAMIIVLTVLGLQAQWSIVQFGWQRDLGFPLLGESYVRADVPGVAKFFLMDHKVVRAYGPYNHPNPLGAAMLLGLVMVMYIPRLKRALATDRMVQVWSWSMGGMLGVALFLTFARSAWAGLGLLALLVLFRKRRGWRQQYLWILLLLILLLVSPFVWWRVVDPESVALTERMLGVSHALTLFSDHRWAGVGLGAYPQALLEWSQETDISLRNWQVTYVHMVPLLALVELGVLGAGLLLAAACYALFRYRLWWLVLPLLPLIMLDHYFYTYPVMWFWLAVFVTVLSKRLSTASD